MGELHVDGLNNVCKCFRKLECQLVFQGIRNIPITLYSGLNVVVCVHIYTVGVLKTIGSLPDF